MRARDAWFLRAMSNRYRATAYLSLFISKKKIYKTITRFGFCNIRDNQGLGKCYQRRPSPHPIIIYEYVQHSFIQHSLRCLQQFLHKTIKAWSTKKFFFTNRHKNLEWETYSLRELKKPSFKKKKNSKCATEYFPRRRFVHWYTPDHF